MTYVVVEDCIKCKHTDCVDVCPVDCFHEGSLFFILIFLAALTSSLSMLEVSVCRLEEIRDSSRPKMAIMLGSAIFLFGFLTVFSFNYLEDVYPLGFIETFATMTAFDLIDYFITSILMPVGGMLYALFIGWWLTKDMTMQGLGLKDGLLFKTWRFLIRYVVPLAILAIFYSNLTA